MADVLIYLFFGVVGGGIGWLAKSAAVERREFEREEQRDAEWDAKHLGGDRA